MKMSEEIPNQGFRKFRKNSKEKDKEFQNSD